MNAAHRSWLWFAGSLMFLFGTGVAIASRVVEQLPLLVTMGALVVGGVVEFVAGESSRRHGSGVAHLSSGVLVIGLAAMLGSSWKFEPDTLTAAPLALLTGVFCVVSATFRVFDLVVFKPTAIAISVLDAAVTLVLGTVLLATWREATPAFLGLVAGIDVLVSGLSVAHMPSTWEKRPAAVSVHAR